MKTHSLWTNGQKWSSVSRVHIADKVNTGERIKASVQKQGEAKILLAFVAVIFALTITVHSITAGDEYTQAIVDLI